MIKSKPLPPLERLQELFDVNTSGLLLYKTKAHHCSRRKIGDEAGYLDHEGYRKVFIDGGRYFAHRIVWFLMYNKDPGDMQVDHINMIKDDNNLSNLRLCNHAQNCLNVKLKPTNTSGIRGVCFSPKGRKKHWRAFYKRKSLGWFATKEEAASAVADAVEKCGDKDFYRGDADA
jgi:hypothetical protein